MTADAVTADDVAAADDGPGRVPGGGPPRRCAPAPAGRADAPVFGRAGTRPVRDGRVAPPAGAGSPDRYADDGDDGDAATRPPASAPRPCSSRWAASPG